MLDAPATARILDGYRRTSATDHFLVPEMALEINKSDMCDGRQMCCFEMLVRDLENRATNIGLFLRWAI